jgi:putative acetyltransferase
VTDFPVRLATDDDGPAIARVLETVFAEYPGCLWEPAEFPELVAPATSFAAMRGRLWVVEHAGRVVGSVGYSRDEQSAELRKLYLLPVARGAGRGRALVELVERETTALGETRIHLWSDTRFVTAHALYERMGYRKLPGTRPLHDVSNTIEYQFEKSLA